MRPAASRAAAERAVDDHEQRAEADQRPQHRVEPAGQVAERAEQERRRRGERVAERRASSRRAPRPRPAASAASSGSVIVSGNSGPIATPSRTAQPQPPRVEHDAEQRAPAAARRRRRASAARQPVVGGPGDEEPDRDRDGVQHREQRAGRALAPAALDVRVGQPGVQPVEDGRHEEERRDEPPGERPAERQLRAAGRRPACAAARCASARARATASAVETAPKTSSGVRQPPAACASGTATVAASAEPIVIPEV